MQAIFRPVLVLQDEVCAATPAPSWRDEQSDTLASVAFWEQALQYQFSDIALFDGTYHTPPPGQTGGAVTGAPLRGSLFGLSLLHYSTGAPMPDDVAPGLRAMGHQFPWMIARFDTKMPGGTAYFGSSAYERCICSLVLFGASATETRAFFTVFDQFNLPNGYDRIWSAFRARMGQGAVSPQTDVYWPKAYANMWLAIDPAEPDFARPHHLRRFLDGWYKTMATELAAQTTRVDNLSENSTHVGYRYVEAAAAAVAFGIDDRDLRDHPHYPKDWADWARAHRKALA